jgi:hypothetical protein
MIVPQVDPHSFPVQAVNTLQLITEQYRINGVQVDNPSGSWLYLPECYSYIPPQTLGWATNLASVKSLRVQFVNAPSGGAASVATGGPIVVTTYSQSLSPNIGTNYTVATQQDLANLIAALNRNTGGMNVPAWGSTVVHAGSVTLHQTGPANGQLYLTALANPPGNTENIWYSDTAYSLPNSIRGNGFWIAPGDKDALVMVGGTQLNIVSETIDQTLHFIDSVLS